MFVFSKKLKCSKCNVWRQATVPPDSYDEIIISTINFIVLQFFSDCLDCPECHSYWFVHRWPSVMQLYIGQIWKNAPYFCIKPISLYNWSNTVMKVRRLLWFWSVILGHGISHAGISQHLAFKWGGYWRNQPKAL